MTANSATRVVIRHLGGSKINQVEQFALRDRKEITVGRDASSAIGFDPQIDDMVSRNHAVIRINQGEPPGFRIADLNSSNGTFLNGERIVGEVELLPEDVVELGSGGAKFSFDVDPRPANLVSRTRVMSPIDALATRVTAATPETAEHAATRTATGTSAVPAKVAVGKVTVQRMLVEERRSTSRVWMSSLAVVIVVAGLAGGALYWRTPSATQLQDEAAQRADQQRKDSERRLAEAMGISAQEIVTKYGDSTVYIEVQWRLYDKSTGKPVFHKTNRYKDEELPCYVRLRDGSIVRWLTIEDEGRANIQVGETLQGSGFVVSDKGFLLTNRHIAAGWLERLGAPWINDEYQYKGWLYDETRSDGRRQRSNRDRPELINLRDKSDQIEKLKDWIPDNGGVLFDPRSPGLIGESRSFDGRNDRLELRFQNDMGSIRGSLVRASHDSDVALIKIDAIKPLRPVDLAADESIQPGEKVIVLGYPAVSTKTYEYIRTDETRGRQKAEFIARPTVTDGLVSRRGSESTEKPGVTTRSTLGDAFQLSITATGQGNSGGPVFNAKGNVIGLFSYSRTYGDTRVTFAVPIKHGSALLR